MGEPNQSQRPPAQHIWAFPSGQLVPLHGLRTHDSFFSDGDISNTVLPPPWGGRQWLGGKGDGSGLGATYLGLLLRLDPQFHGFEEVAGNKPLLQRR